MAQIPPETDSGRHHCRRCGGLLGPATPESECPRCALQLAARLLGDQDRAQESGEVLSSREGQHLRYLGDYELVELLDEGGMGQVYRARQISVNRELAVKILHRSYLNSPRAVQRFRNEVEAVASLEHPHILPIYEAGEDGGIRFFSMRLAQGGSLAAALIRGQWRLTEGSVERERQQQIATFMATVAKALHYAHQRGVIHRDLKPGNILLGAESEPLVADFGLAKAVDRDEKITRSHELLGTPAYMAPEQIQGAQHATVSSDVYSLGIVLYELLTGRVPFIASTFEATLEQIRRDEPDPPSRHNSLVDKDLSIVCLKCLEKEPGRRYGSAEALADDLERWLRHEQILARPGNSWDRARKWVQRNPALAVGSLAVLLSLLVGVITTTWQWRRAEARAGDARASLYAADMQMADRVLLAGDLGRTRRLLEEHLPKHGEADERGIEWRYLWHASRGDSVRTLSGHSEKVNSVAFTPDGRHLISGAWESKILVWDLATGLQETNLALPDDKALSVAVSPDGNLLALGTARGPARVVSWPGLKPVAKIPVAYSRVSFSPDGRQLALGYGAANQTFGQGGGDVLLWDTQTHEALRRFRGVGSRAVFSSDSRWLVMGTSGEGLISIWDRRAERISQVISNAGHVINLAVSPDGQWVARVNSNDPVTVWETESGRPVASLTNHQLMAWSVAFSPNSRWLFTAGNDQTVRRWAVSNWTAAGLWRGHNDQIWSIAVSPDGASFATGAKDKTVRLWSVEPPSLTPSPLVSDASSSVLLPDLNLLASGSSKRTVVEIWEPGSSRLVRSLENECYARAATKGWLATVDNQNELNVWQTSDWHKRLQIARPAHAGTVLAAVFAPGGQQLASSGTNGEVYLHSLQTPDKFVTLGASDLPILRLLFSLDGQTLFGASQDQAVYLWDVVRRRHIGTLKGHTFAVHTLALSLDGRTLASGSGDGTVRLWDWRQQRGLATLAGHTAGVFGVAFTGDGHTLASASEDRTVVFWHLATRREMLTLQCDSAVSEILFLPAGDQILTRQTAGKIRMWPAPFMTP